MERKRMSIIGLWFEIWSNFGQRFEKKNALLPDNEYFFRWADQKGF